MSRSWPEVPPDAQVRVDAIQIRSADAAYGWVLLVHDVLVEVVVRQGECTHYSVTRQDYHETGGSSMRTLVRVPELTERMGLAESDVTTLSVSFAVAREVYERLADVDSGADQSGANELILHVGKHVRDHVR